MQTKEEKLQYQRDWYAKNKERRKVQLRAQKDAMRRLVAEAKTAGCIRCGEAHPACLDFHHRDPATKSGSLAEIQRLGWGREKILAEIDKCDLLCANCHRKLHYEEDN